MADIFHKKKKFIGRNYQTLSREELGRTVLSLPASYRQAAP